MFSSRIEIQYGVFNNVPYFGITLYLSPPPSPLPLRPPIVFGGRAAPVVDVDRSAATLAWDYFGEKANGEPTHVLPVFRCAVIPPF